MTVCYSGYSVVCSCYRVAQLQADWRLSRRWHHQPCLLVSGRLSRRHSPCRISHPSRPLALMASVAQRHLPLAVAGKRVSLQSGKSSDLSFPGAASDCYFNSEPACLRRDLYSRHLPTQQHDQAHQSGVTCRVFAHRMWGSRSDAGALVRCGAHNARHTLAQHRPVPSHAGAMAWQARPLLSVSAGKSGPLSAGTPPPPPPIEGTFSGGPACGGEGLAPFDICVGARTPHDDYFCHGR